MTTQSESVKMDGPFKFGDSGFVYGPYFPVDGLYISDEDADPKAWLTFTNQVWHSRDGEVASQAAKIAELEEENMKLRDPDLRTVLAFEGGQLSAQEKIKEQAERIKELEEIIWRLENPHDAELKDARNGA